MPKKPSSLLFVACLALGILMPVSAPAGAVAGSLSQATAARGCVSETGTTPGGGTCVDGHSLLGAAAVEVSPDGDHVYVGSFNSDTIAIFERSGTGYLTQQPGPAGCISNGGVGGCTTGRELNGPLDLEFSADGLTLFVANRDSNSIAVLDRDPLTGALSQPAGTLGCIKAAGDGVNCMAARALALPSAIENSGSELFVATAANGGSIVRLVRNPDGSFFQPISSEGCASANGGEGCYFGIQMADPRALAASADGANLYIGTFQGAAIFNIAGNNFSQLMLPHGCINATGSSGCTASTPSGETRGVEVSPDDKHVYLLSEDGNLVGYTRSGTGSLTRIAGEPGCVADVGSAGVCSDATAMQQSEGLGASSDGKFMYAGNLGGSVTTVKRTPSTGAIKAPAGTAGCISNLDGGCATGKALDGAFDVAVHGWNVYVASLDDNAVAVLNRERPLFSRSLSLSYSGRKDSFVGRVSSSATACERKVVVTVFKKRSGADLKVGKDTTSKSGSYRIAAKKKPGRHYAAVKKQTVASGICASATSPVKKLS